MTDVKMLVVAHCGCNSNTRLTTSNPVEVRDALNLIREHCHETGHTCAVTVEFRKNA